MEAWISPTDFDRMLFLIQRIDEVSDVVTLYTILREGTEFRSSAYTWLKYVDAGNTLMVAVNMVGDDRSLTVKTITPPDELADRVYGFDLSFAGVDVVDSGV